jgi:hypothetical protein
MIDLRLVKYWYQGGSAWTDIAKESRDDFRQKLVPELLVKNDDLIRIDRARQRNFLQIAGPLGPEAVWVNQHVIHDSAEPPADEGRLVVRDATMLMPFALRPDEPREIWLTVRVPAGATPGIYTGEIRVDSDEGPAKSAALELIIRPFQLGEPRIIYSIYYRAQLEGSGKSLGSEFRTESQMTSDLKDMMEHGIRYPSTYQEPRRLDLLQNVLRARKRVGIVDGPLFYLGIQTTSWSLAPYGQTPETALERLVPALVRVAAEFNQAPVYIYGRDEASGQELRDQRALWATVHRLGGRVFVAGSTGSHRVVGDLLDMQVSYGAVDVSEAQRWHSTKKKILSYANPQSGPENPYPFRLNYGLMLWAAEYDGAMPYAYQHCFGSCWNDSDHPVYRDHNLTYPTTNGSIPTLAWEGMREGIDDVRYVELLEAEIGSSGVVYTKAVEAQGYLDRLRKDVLAAANGRVGRHSQDAQLDLDVVRGQVAERIEGIRQRTAGR